jgi:30S ribosomal protein S31
MGKGDKKTAKGKRYAGSYGNARSHTTKTVAATKTVAKPAVKKAAPAAAKKAPAKKPAA